MSFLGFLVGSNCRKFQITCRNAPCGKEGGFLPVYLLLWASLFRFISDNSSFQVRGKC